jgi:tetratricopeptide (TPR) repeat protein
MKRLPFLVLCLFLLISGCEKKKGQTTPAEEPLSLEAPAALLNTATLLQEPIEAHLFELPVQALSVWRSYRRSKPTLVLLSQDPFLQRIPDALQKEAIDLILKGTPEEIAERTSMPGPNPLLLPWMAVDTALRSNLFSEVVWIFPSTVPKDQLDVAQFRQQLLEFGAIDEDEAQSFIPLAGGFAGTVRGLPFHAVPPDALPILERPVVLHIDLGFFQPLYKGEIKTKIYPLLYDSLRLLRDGGLQTAAVTISFSNMSGTLPLAVRFIGPTLTHLVNNPEMLDNKLPLNWQRRADALYLPNFFKTEEARDLFLAMETDLPGDPSVKYDLYQNSRELKEGDKALDYLKQAVALDPVYALEYSNLASLALERGLPEQAVKMLRLAEEAMPENPQISLLLAAQLNDLNHPVQTRKILEKLRALPWSTVYFPDMEAHIEAMSAAAKEMQRQ